MNIKDKIIEANILYRQGTPIMSDQEFDDFLEEYEKTVSKEEFISFKNTLHEIKGKVKHPFVMGSLDKLKIEEPENIKKFLDKYVSNGTLNVSTKVDGISARLHYENGKLISASTRGDGTFGEDITDKIWFVNHIPHEIDIKETIDIRGELVILTSDFEKISDKFANPRNATAGIINRKEYDKSDVSCVSFIAYTILGPNYSKKEQFELLKVFNFYIPYQIDLDINFESNLLETLNNLASANYDYGIDGLVICNSDYKNEDKYRPDACAAVKINQLIAQTILLDIEWSGPSKDGFFTPIGLIEPVELGGSTISRVTLHNLDFIEEKNLMYGSKINIVKSGDIIPKVLSVISNDINCVSIKPIDVCPSCGSELTRVGVNMMCENDLCGDKVLTEVYSFIRKLGVKSATEKSLAKFGIFSFCDLSLFKANPKKKAEVKLEQEIYNKVFSRSKVDLISAMNFNGISEKILDKIFNHYGFDRISNHFNVDGRGIEGTWGCNVESLSKELNTMPLPSGVGTQFLNKFLDGINNAVINAFYFIDNHEKYHYTENSNNYEPTQEIKGYIVVTGSLNSGSRNSFLEKAKSFGWESQGAVNKKTTYLINNDVTSNSSKNKKAKELGVTIISEEDFLKLCNAVETDLDSL